MVNSSWGSYEKLQLLDADSLAAMIRHVDNVFKQGVISTTLRTGVIINTKLHPEWKKAGPWKGRTVDLKAAYKQLCVKPSSWWSCVLAVLDTDRECVCFLPEITLPFGSAASVLHFNRAARLIWRIGVCELSLLWCNFYDDYPTVTGHMVSNAVQAAITIFLKAIGWNFSDKPGKDLPFDESFNALGIKFNVGRIPSGCSSLENRPDRRDKVVKDIRDIINSGTFFHFQAEVIRGKVQFMERQVFGRAARAIVRVFDRKQGPPALSIRDVADLEWMSAFLDKAHPRQITPTYNMPTVIVFTDGACEYENGKAVVTCGAMLYESPSEVIHCFGISINDDLCNEWRLEGKNQLVTEAELLPVLISRVFWHKFLRHRKVINFIDSNPALFSCIKGSSESENCNNIVKAISIAEVDLCLWPWYTRVPSLSNCADWPSRLKEISEFWNKMKVIMHEVPQPLSLKSGLWNPFPAK